MFSGIIQSVAQVLDIAPLSEDGRQITVSSELAQLADTRIGDSIAINGVCLTVVTKDAQEKCTRLSFDVSAHTMRTTNLNTLISADMQSEVGSDVVNLEPSLRVGESLDGHIVYGHVDTVCEVLSHQQQAESWELVLRCPRDYAHLVCQRGSVAINGISLTIAELQDEQDAVVIKLVIIPHTHQHTSLRCCKEGDLVNIEFDMLARYVARQHTMREPCGD